MYEYEYEWRRRCRVVISDASRPLSIGVMGTSLWFGLGSYLSVRWRHHELLACVQVVARDASSAAGVESVQNSLLKCAAPTELVQRFLRTFNA